MKKLRWRLKIEDNIGLSTKSYYPQYLIKTIFGNERWYAPMIDCGEAACEIFFFSREEALEYIENGGKIIDKATYDDVT